MDNFESNYVFCGDYKVVSLYIKVYGLGWKLFKKYTNNGFLWEFSSETDLSFAHDRVAFSGKFREIFFGNTTFTTEFKWYPEESYLYLDLKNYIYNTPRKVSINNSYRVESINRTDLWLYDLENVNCEPDDFRCKLKLRSLYS